MKARECYNKIAIVLHLVAIKEGIDFKSSWTRELSDQQISEFACFINLIDKSIMLYKQSFSWH